MQHKELKKLIIQQVDEVLSTSLLNRTQLTSDVLYNALGVRRTVLVRKHPELTQHIHTKLTDAKKRQL